MGRLGGFRYREVTRRLRQFGYAFEREGAGSHEIWKHRATGVRLLIANHPRAIAEGTLRAILRHAGIEPEDFLAD